MDTTETNHTFLLSYCILGKRIEELYFTKTAAIERMCRLGKGCVRIVS